MGGFFLAVKRDGNRAAILADQARQQFRRSGLGEPVRIEDPAYVLDYYPKHDRNAEDLVCLEGTDFIASTGTLIYRNRCGVEALRLISRVADPETAVANCRGHFTIIMRRSGKTLLLRDALGAYQIYSNEDLSVITTSFLALARCLPRRSISVAECVEYALNGVTFGTGTPIQEIRRLDLGEMIAFSPMPRITHRKVPLLPQESRATFPSQLQRNISVLRDYTESFVEAFGGKVKIGFSGGYDSRLMLALLRAEGITPSLFVYGSKDSPDVCVAKEIASRENIPLEHVDKEAFRPVTPDSFPEMVCQNFDWNDGFSQFGVFGSDAENLVRAERSRPPGVVLNGGGGEVFRNYFKFHGRKLSVRNFVRNFFSHFDSRILAAPSFHALFEDGLVVKITSLLGLNGSTLDRRQIECLYPHLRCHSWFGRANSIDTRFGDIILPYYDQRVLEAALALPAKWKHFGNFQSRMIRELDPRLAAYQSAHGFPFDRNTPIKGMAPDLLLYALPPAVRRYNYRIKQKLLTHPSRRRALTQPFLAAVMDPKFPIMSRVFNLKYVNDNFHLNRIATLEYLFQNLNANVPERVLESVC